MTVVVETEREPAYRWSYRDCWPWPMGLDLGMTPQETAGSYRGSLIFFLDSEFLPQSPVTDNALLVTDKYLPQLLAEERWKNYQVKEMGDMNVGTHTLKQAGITAQALCFDADKLGVNYQEKDIMIAAALLHDLGELATGDLTYDVKVQRGKTSEIEEARAVAVMIDEIIGLDQNGRGQLKEVYVRVATSLGDDEVAQLIGPITQFTKGINWQTLRDLFNLYERYGYLITAIQQMPLPLVFKDEGLTDEEQIQIRSWNRAELEQALAKGYSVTDRVKGAVLFRNVLTNQWPHLGRAVERNIPSARVMFDNSLVHYAAAIAKRWLNLDLDLSIFQ